MKKILFALLAIGLVACSKDDNATPSNSSNNTVITPTSTAYTYFIGKIGDKAVNYEAFISTDTKYIGDYGTSGGLSVDPNINYSGGISSMTYDNPESIDIDFMNFMTGVEGITESTHEKEFFGKLFKAGNYNFVSTEAGNKDVLGVGVNYKKDGKTYSTNGSQPSTSNFKILTVSNPEFLEGGYGQKTITITGFFSCRLFDIADPTKYTDMKDMSFKIMIVSNKSLM